MEVAFPLKREAASMDQKGMKTNPYATMRRSILASMILLPGTVFIIVLAIGYYYFKTSIETSTISSMKRIVDDHRHMIDSFLGERKANLDFVLQSYAYDDLSDPVSLGKIFKAISESLKCHNLLEMRYYYA